MWVQKIPEFHKGRILRLEMIAELSAYLRLHRPAPDRGAAHQPPDGPGAPCVRE